MAAARPGKLRFGVPSVGVARASSALTAAVRAARPRTVLMAVACLQLAAFLTLALLRTVDADEGFYLLASRLVFEGRLPYSDFLYTQMPLLPYVYGAWMKLFGVNWYAARTLSAVLAAALGTLLYLYVERVFKSRGLALIGVCLFATSAFTLAWHTVVMTYALSGLLLFGAIAALGSPGRSPSVSRALTSGALLGLAIDTRLLVLAAVPAFLFEIARASADVGRGRRLGGWLGGLALALIPALGLAAANWDGFAFGNLGFHASRNATGNLIGNWGQKGAILAELLNVRSAGGETITFQMPLLLGLNAYYVWLVMRGLAPLTISCTASLAVGLALLLPTPTYSQYFVILVPLLITNALYAMHVARLHAPMPLATPFRTHVHAGLGVFLALYALVVPVVYYRYLSWLSPALPDLHQVDPRPWSIPAIRAMSAAIERSSTTGEVVLTWWPGYLFETRSAPPPGMENHGWMEISTDPRPRRPVIATRESVNAMLAGRQTRLVVPGLLAPPDERALALANGYTRAASVAGMDLLSRPD